MEGYLRRSPAVRYSFIRSRFEVVLRVTHEGEYFGEFGNAYVTMTAPFALTQRKRIWAGVALRRLAALLRTASTGPPGKRVMGLGRTNQSWEERSSWIFERTIGYCMLQWRFRASGEIRAALCSLPNYRDENWFDSPRAWCVRSWIDVRVLRYWNCWHQCSYLNVSKRDAKENMSDRAWLSRDREAPRMFSIRSRVCLWRSLDCE